MKKRLSLALLALALATTVLLIGCGAKTTAQIPEQSPEEAAAGSAEALHEGHSSPEAEMQRETAPEEAAAPMVEIPSSSVLHLIPEQPAAVVYFPSLLALNDRVNMLAAELMPTPENPEIIAEILADMFGAGFEDLTELEEIGLDMSQDFAIFVTDVMAPRLSAIVHLKDPLAIQQVIDAEAEGSSPRAYNGVTYWTASGADGSFAIIEDLLVFSQSSEICESVIDAYKGAKPAITTHANYGAFLTDVAAGSAQLAIYLDLETIAPLVSERIQGESESMKDGLESDPAAMAAAPFFESLSVWLTDTLAQLKSLNATLAVEGTDVTLSPFLQFKRDSKIQNVLSGMAAEELKQLGELPGQAILNGAFQGKPELIVEMNMAWLNLLSQNATPDQNEKLAALAKQTEDFYKALADEWAFSMSLNDTFMPDYLIVYGVKDEPAARAYMETGLLKQLQDTMEAMQGLMDIESSPGFGMYEGAHPGEPTSHNGVEIKSYVFPNFGASFGDMPPEMAGILPDVWRWSYAFADGQLLMAIGSDALIRTALDNRAGVATLPAFSEETSYERLTSALGLESNLFLAMSPITLVKSALPIIARVSDPNSAAAMQMLSGMFMNLPENYSIGFSAKTHDEGVGAKLLLTLGDFKQILQVFAMMQGMGQMQ